MRDSFEQLVILHKLSKIKIRAICSSLTRMIDLQNKNFLQVSWKMHVGDVSSTVKPFLAAALLPAHHFHHFNNLIFSIGKTRLIKSKTNQFQTDEVLYQILVNNDNYGDVGNLERKNNIGELDR